MENKLTANQFAKKIGKQAVQVIREIEKGNITAYKKKVEKVEYVIPASELKKYR